MKENGKAHKLQIPQKFLALKMMVVMGGSGVLSACQEGHSFSTRYHHGIPAQQQAKNTPRPHPLPRDKPKPPPKKYAGAPKAVSAPASAKSPASGQSITVRKGDTIYALSRRHDVTVRAIIQANRLKPPYLLYPGQKLAKPGTAVHVVRKGDTIYSLSRRYKVDMTSFARMNSLKRPYLLAIGQKLKVPGVVAERKNYNSLASLPPPPPQSGAGFMWPVKGRILSSFGPKDKGYHNDGINIAARAGAYVSAAESGVVVHAGRKIKGFGNLILIRHANGWITAYAHNSSILVKKGQAIKRGQVIARVGQTGGVKHPQLHFEMRKGARAVNPVRYLKS